MLAGTEGSTTEAARAGGPGLLASLPALEPLLVGPEEGLFLFSPTFTYLYVNAAGAAMSGVSADDLVGDSFVERFPAVVDNGIVASMRLAMESGEAQHFGPIRYDDGNVVGDFEHLHLPVPGGVLVLVKRLDGAAGKGAPVTLARAAELAHREAELSAILDVLPVGASVLGEDGSVVRANAALGRLLRLTDDEIASGRYRDRTFLRPDGTTMPPAEFASSRARAEGRPVTDVEMGVVLDDGSVVWASVSAAPVDAPGLSVVVVTQDITMRRLADEVLRERGLELREAQRIAHLGSALWDRATDTVTWSAEMYDLFGLEPGHPAPSFAQAATLFVPESFARVRATAARALDTGEPYEDEYEIIRPDGTSRTLAFRGEPRRDASGVVVGIRSIAYDVTERRETQRLREREAQLAEAQRIAQIGSWTWDPARDIGTWSDEMRRIHGFDPADPVPSFAEMTAFITPATLPQLTEAVARALATGTPYEVDIDIVRPDGSLRNLVSRGEAIRDETGAIVLLRGTDDDITEWRAAERRFRTLFHTGPFNGVIYRFVRDATGEIVDWEYVDINARGAAAAGLPADQLIGRRMSEVIGIDAMTPYIEVSREVARSGAPRTFETHFAHDDRDYLSSVFLLGGDQYAIVSVDITERRRAEEALRESEAGYRSLFTHMQEGLAHCRIEREDGRPADWTYLSVNAAFEAQTGLRGAAGRRASGLIPGIIDSDPDLLAIYGRVASGGGPERFESHVAALDAWFDVSVYSPAPDEFVAIFDVITERKRAEEALRAAAARDSLLVDASNDGIFRVAMPRGRFLDANPAACAIFGRTREELLGADLVDMRDAATPDDGPASVLTIPPDALAGGTATLERVFIRPDGSRASLSARLRLLPDGTILVNARDRTRERALEQQVEQAQRMEAVGRLAGGIAHDFNNLLTAINGYASLALEALSPADPLRSDVDAIREAGERGAVLTRQLLAFSRRQTLQPAEVDVGAVVAGLRPILTRLIGEDVTLFVRSDAAVGAVFADPAQLEQVVINLVTNARDAMPDGGALAIETTGVEIGAEDPRLRRPALPGRYVRLAVTDTGTGIDEATIGHVFEPFYTTKATGRGTGLGLSTVEGVVAQSGGFISIESTQGRGTTVDVFLPRIDATVVGRARLPGIATTTLPRGTEGILLVEDEPAVRAVAGRMLRDLGYAVIEATGPTQALAIAADHTDVFDLVITDVVMPEMNGRVLAERISSQRPALVVLFMSGYSPENVFRQGYLVEGAAYLQKPFTRADLAVAVRSVLDARKSEDAQGSGSGVRR